MLIFQHFRLFEKHYIIIRDICHLFFIKIVKSSKIVQKMVY